MFNNFSQFISVATILKYYVYSKVMEECNFINWTKAEIWLEYNYGEYVIIKVWVYQFSIF